jgi:hypothetical protein
MSFTDIADRPNTLAVYTIINVQITPYLKNFIFLIRSTILRKNTSPG